MSKTISMSDEAYSALVAALDDYEVRICQRHPGYEHGDERQCEGWGPRSLGALDEAKAAVKGA